MSLFWSTFLIIFIAEIADKSRVVGLFLATLYRNPWPIFWGMTLGYALLDGIAVLLGATLSIHVPSRWIQIGSSIIFISLGVVSFLVGENVEEKGRNWIRKIERWGPFLVSFIAISLS